MSILWYLALSCGFLFLFFLANDYTSDHSWWVYLQWAALAMVFICLLKGIAEWIDSYNETENRKKKEKDEAYSAYQTTIRTKIDSAKKKAGKRKFPF